MFFLRVGKPASNLGAAKQAQNNSDFMEKEGGDVELDVKEGGIHVWQGVEDIMDLGTYLKTKAGEKVPEGLLKGCSNVAEAVLKDVQK